jgi:hypothetical protein
MLHSTYLLGKICVWITFLVWSLPNLDDSLEFPFTNAYFSLCVNGRGTEGAVVLV